MPRPRIPAPRRRSTLAPRADPLETMDFAVAALRTALAQAAPKEAPAIARQLMAAMKEREQAQQRRRTREQEAVFDAACEQEDSEIDAMVAALRQVFPRKPPSWGDCTFREVAEAMHGEGLMDMIMVLPHLPEDPPEPGPPPGYWDAYMSRPGENVDDGEYDDEGDGADPPSPPCAGPRIRSL